MAGPGERWPPIYDADDLKQQISQLSGRTDLQNAFYEWRRDASTQVVEDVCQGDVVELTSEVPVLVDDGQPSAIEHPDAAWLVIGNTCDIERVITDVRWTQLVPIYALGRRNKISAHEIAAIERYTQSRTFHIPPWSAERASNDSSSPAQSRRRDFAQCLPGSLSGTRRRQVRLATTIRDCHTRRARRPPSVSPAVGARFKGYRKETGVARDSSVETFAASSWTSSRTALPTVA